MASNIPVIVQGNSFSLAIPLQIYYINGDQMDLEDYTPDPTDEVSVQLKGSRRNYTYTPTIDGNVAYIDLTGNELADNYGVVVSVVKANGQRLRSFRTDQFFIVESSDDLTPADIIEGLEENVIYLNAQPFIAGADGRGIESIVKTATAGLVDTYTITYSDNTTSTFNVTNGAAGAQGADGVGITSIEKTATVGLVDTYTITLSNGETSTFDVTNGKDGVDLGLATIVNDLTTGGATDVLSAEMGKVLGERTTMRKQMPCYALCTKGAYYNSSGVLTSNNSYMYAFIRLEDVTHLNVTGALSTRVWYFGSDGTTPLGNTTTADVDASSFPSGAVYAAISYTTLSTDTLTIDYAMPAVTNEVEDGHYKYKKITAPTGPWNLAYNTGEQSYVNGYGGVLGFIPVLGADFIFCAQNDATKGVICFYDENFAYISGFNYCRAAKVPSTAKYAKIRCNSVAVGIVDIYLFEGEANEFDRIAHLERDVALLKPMPLNGKTVAFLGDSITATYTGQYVDIFAARTGCAIERLAVAGTAYAGGGIASQADNLTGNEALVVVMAGTNDFGHGDPIGNIYDESGGTIIPTTDTTTTCSGVHAVIQGIYAKCPTAKIIIITPPQRSTGWTANTQGKYLYEYVDAIKKVAQLYGVLVVDQFANCNINPVFSAMKSMYFNDGTHPNPLYHKLLADWLYNAIADWIREPYL